MSTQEILRLTFLYLTLVFWFVMSSFDIPKIYNVLADIPENIPGEVLNELKI